MLFRSKSSQLFSFLFKRSSTEGFIIVARTDEWLLSLIPSFFLPRKDSWAEKERGEGTHPLPLSFLIVRSRDFTVTPFPLLFIERSRDLTVTPSPLLFIERSRDFTVTPSPLLFIVLSRDFTVTPFPLLFVERSRDSFFIGFQPNDT